MKRLSAAALVLAMAAGPGVASAQTAQVGDVRCLITMAALASNPAAKEQALPGVYYFAARVTQRAPNFDFAKDLRAEADKMSMADFQAEAARCGAALVAVSRSLVTAQESFKGFTPKP